MIMNFKKLAVIIGAVAAFASLDVGAQTADASAPLTTAPANSAVSAKAAKKAARKADHALEKAVRVALAKDKSVDVTRVTVRARDGAVTLLGSVPEQGQVDAATQAAKGVAGVKSLNNALTIKAVGQ
jgi:hyperosmotically inducible periplasmic protein